MRQCWVSIQRKMWNDVLERERKKKLQKLDAKRADLFYWMGTKAKIPHKEICNSSAEKNKYLRNVKRDFIFEPESWILILSQNIFHFMTFKLFFGQTCKPNKKKFKNQVNSIFSVVISWTFVSKVTNIFSWRDLKNAKHILCHCLSITQSSLNCTDLCNSQQFN